MEDNSQNQNAGAAPAQAQTSFDPDRFKNEIIGMNRQFMETLQQTNATTLQAILDANKSTPAPQAPPATGKGFYSDKFSNEVEKLGLDEEQAGAIIGLFEKVLEERVPNFEKNILNKVDTSISFKEKKLAHERDVISKYPMVQDKSSSIYQEAKRIFDSELSEGVKASPEGMSIAVLRAASNLGIKPVTLEDLRASAAENPTGAGGETKKSSGEATQADLDFAASFGVGAELFKEKLKAVRSR